jgi:type IV pilus assembly protein PilM
VLFSSKKLVAIDLGANSVKVCELDVGRKSATISSFGICPLPPRSFSNGDILNPEEVSRAIREAIRMAKVKRKKAIVGLSGSSSIIKKISIPKVQPKLVSEQLKWEAEQYLPFDISSVHIGYHLLKTFRDDGMMDLLLVATPLEVISNYTSVVQEAGLKPEILDISSFALFNFFEFNMGGLGAKDLVFLYVGASTTNFLVIQNGELVFARDIASGGNVYTATIQKELGVSFPEAEALKLSSLRGEEVPSEVPQYIQSSHDLLKGEIKNTFDFFLAMAQEFKPEKIYLSGGASPTLGLRENLSRALGHGIDLVDPFSRFAITSQLKSQVGLIRSLGPQALGLALRKLGDM